MKKIQETPLPNKPGLPVNPKTFAAAKLGPHLYDVIRRLLLEPVRALGELRPLFPRDM